MTKEEYKNTLTPLEKGKLEKVLNNLIRHEGEVITVEEYINTLIKLGYNKPTVTFGVSGR